MDERRLGPVVGLGTYATFEDDEGLATAVIDAALASGSTVFDSSPIYGAAERSLSVALTDRRAAATVATKIWATTVEEGRAQYAEQQRLYGRVEFLQIHNLVAWRDHLPWLQEELEAGRIDRLGVTHWDVGQFADLERALETGFFQTLQVPLNPFERDCEARVLPLAAERDVAVLVMRPLGGARGAELRRDPGLSAIEPLVRLRYRNVGSGAPQVVPVGFAHRSCDPRHVTNGTCCRGRGWRGGAAVRPRRTASRRETCRRRVMSDHECGMVPPR